MTTFLNPFELKACRNLRRARAGCQCADCHRLRAEEAETKRGKRATRPRKPDNRKPLAIAALTWVCWQCQRRVVESAQCPHCGLEHPMHPLPRNR